MKVVYVDAEVIDCPFTNSFIRYVEKRVQNVGYVRKSRIVEKLNPPIIIAIDESSGLYSTGTIMGQEISSGQAETVEKATDALACWFEEVEGIDRSDCIEK
jgi:hypothetical protein